MSGSLSHNPEALTLSQLKRQVTTLRQAQGEREGEFTPPRSEEGAALLAVLLLVAIMAALAAASLERLQLATRLAGNIAALDQSRAFATGAESLAVLRVNDLLERDRGKTTLAGDWLGRETALPLPGGGVALARLWDGSNCFNLNSVARGDDPAALTTDQVGVIQFSALMTALRIPRGDAERIAWSLADWIDADSIPARQGNEDRSYSQAETAYRTGNTMLAEVSELRAVAGVTPAYYERMRPWLCALPTTELSPINVNTLLPEQAPLIAMLLPNRLDANGASQVIAARPEGGWNSIADFWNQPVLANQEPMSEVIGQPQIRTRYFRLELDVQHREVAVQQSALIDASVAPARIVSRRWGRDE